MVAKIASRLSMEPWTAHIVAQDEGRQVITIDAGRSDGVQEGQTFDVYRPRGRSQ